jgi:hypothetical protein
MPLEQINNNGYQMFLDTDSVFAPRERGLERQAKQNALAREQAVRNALAQSYNPKTGLTNYEFAHSIGGVDIAPELQAARQADALRQEEFRGKQATIDKARADAAKTNNELMISHLQTMGGLIGAAKDERSYQANVRQAAAMGYDVSELPPNFDANYVANLHQRALTAEQQLKQQNEEATLAATQARDQATAAYQTGQLGVAKRNAAVNEAAEARLSSTLEAPIAPKERQKREAAYPKASAAFRGTTTELDTQIKDLKALRDHPGLSGITGLVYGRTPAITGAGREANAILKTILARGGFQELAKMRANSPTGGALGNVSDTEGRYLRDSYASFDTTQDTPSFQRAIDRAIAQAESSKLNIQQAYDDTYSYRQGAAPDGKPAAPAAPAVGTIEEGHRFKGGNPNDAKNWEPI